MRGVAIVGRPVARGADDGWTAEVTRCCTDGARNACSMLYAAAWRAVRALGYRKLITYTLAAEGGGSLRAAGFKVVGEVAGRSWSCPRGRASTRIRCRTSSAGRSRRDVLPRTAPAERRAHFERAFSVNRLRTRKSRFACRRVDHGLGCLHRNKHARALPHEVEEYAAESSGAGRGTGLLAAVAQDFMCEPHIVEQTGLTVAEHQRLTVERYDELVKCDVGGVYIMPVLQGYSRRNTSPARARCSATRLRPACGSASAPICKRNGNPRSIWKVLHRHQGRAPGSAPARVRPEDDVARRPAHPRAARHRRLDGLVVCSSQAGRNANDWREAKSFADRIAEAVFKSPWQGRLFKAAA
jgi:hypothetical protein